MSHRKWWTWTYVQKGKDGLFIWDDRVSQSRRFLSQKKWEARILGWGQEPAKNCLYILGRNSGLRQIGVRGPGLDKSLSLNVTSWKLCKVGPIKEYCQSAVDICQGGIQGTEPKANVEKGSSSLTQSLTWVCAFQAKSWIDDKPSSSCED